MASQQGIVDFIVDQLAGAGDVSARKMFGDYGLFLHGKMIGFIADDRLLFKPTEAGRRLFREVHEAQPYPGAKPCLQVLEEDWDERDWLVQVARATWDELPAPKPKAKRAKGPAD